MKVLSWNIFQAGPNFWFFRTKGNFFQVFLQLKNCTLTLKSQFEHFHKDSISKAFSGSTKPWGHCWHLSASKLVPNSVTSWHLIHWHSKFQLALIFDRRRVFPTVHGRYLVVISVPFGISCNAVTTIRRSGWIWNLALLTQLMGWKKKKKSILFFRQMGGKKLVKILSWGE